MARTHKFSAEQVAEVLTVSHGLVHIAAQSLGCSPKTVYSYLGKFPTVKAARENATEHVVDFAESKLFEAIDKGESWAIALMLKTKGKVRGYVERHEQAHTGEVGVNVIRGPQKAATAEEWAELAREHSKLEDAKHELEKAKHKLAAGSNGHSS